MYISILHERKRIRLRVDKIEETLIHEKYRITARNKSFVLQSNRPLLKSKGLKFKKPIWKIIEGGELRDSIVQEIIRKIEEIVI